MQSSPWPLTASARSLRLARSCSRQVALAPADGTVLLVFVALKPESELYKLIGTARQVVFVYPLDVR